MLQGFKFYLGILLLVAFFPRSLARPVIQHTQSCTYSEKLAASEIRKYIYQRTDSLLTIAESDILPEQGDVILLYLNKFAGDVILSPFNVEVSLEELETGEKASMDKLKANTRYTIEVTNCAEGEFNELYWITPDQKKTAPENKTSRDLYLPEEHTWIDFWNGERFEGGREITVYAPIDKIPLFCQGRFYCSHGALYSIFGREACRPNTDKNVPGSRC